MDRDRDNDTFWRVLLKNVKAKAVNANGRGMLLLPAVIGHFTQVTKLTLSHNQLQTLPEELTALTKLEELHLGNNSFATLPGVLQRLRALRVLYLFNNKLTALDPPVLAALSRLTLLSLNNNMLHSVPEEIGALTSLQNLSLESNRLSALPESIGKLAQLRRLSLRGNVLPALPDAVAALGSLEEIVLTDNKFAHVPECLLRCQRLREVDLSLNYILFLETWALKKLPWRLFLEGNPMQLPARSARKPPHAINTLRELCLRRVALRVLSGDRSVAARLDPELMAAIDKAEKCAACGGMYVLEHTDAVRFQSPPANCVTNKRMEALPVLVRLCSTICFKRDPNLHLPISP